MDLRQMHYINMVVESGSITKAAKELYISQPSLSHIIAKTEKELGGRIFDRSTTPLTLTYAGERYMEKVRQILLLNQELIKEFRDISQNLKGRLRIGVPRERAAFMLPLILPEFKKQYPGVEIDIVENKGTILREEAQKGRMDFIILPAHVMDNSFEFIKIYEEELLLIARRGMVSQEQLIPGNRYAVDLSKFNDAPFILLPQGHTIRDSIDLLFDAHKVSPRTVLETTSSIAAYRMAASGYGFAIVPRITVSLTSFAEQPEIFSLTEYPVTWEISAIYRKDAYIGIVEKTFFDIAREALTPFSTRKDIVI